MIGIVVLNYILVTLKCTRSGLLGLVGSESKSALNRKQSTYFASIFHPLLYPWNHQVRGPAIFTTTRVSIPPNLRQPRVRYRDLTLADVTCALVRTLPGYNAAPKPDAGGHVLAPHVLRGHTTAIEVGGRRRCQHLGHVGSTPTPKVPRVAPHVSCETADLSTRYVPQFAANDGGGRELVAAQ